MDFFRVLRWQIVLSNYFRVLLMSLPCLSCFVSGGHKVAHNRKFLKSDCFIFFFLVWSFTRYNKIQIQNLGCGWIGTISNYYQNRVNCLGRRQTFKFYLLFPLPTSWTAPNGYWKCVGLCNTAYIGKKEYTILVGLLQMQSSLQVIGKGSALKMLLLI